MRGHLSFYLLSFFSIALFLLLQLFDPPLLRENLESKTYDLRLQVRNRLRPPLVRPDILVVAVDEKSLAEIGRWPWSRRTMAQLVRKLSAAGPKVIGIDIMFSEKESAEADGELGAAVRAAGNVVLATAFIETDAARGNVDNAPDYLWDSAFMEVKSVPGIDWTKWAASPNQVLPPIPEIGAAATLGHVTTYADLDGVLRWELLYVRFGSDCYPSLSLQIARLAAGLTPAQMVLYPGSAVLLGDVTLPIDLSGRALINYRGRERTFRTLSAADVLGGRVPQQLLHNAIVLVGTSALATYDQKITPFSADMPGVEKNANVVQNLLEADFIRRSPGVIELAAIIVTSLLLVLVLPRLSARRGVVFGAVLIGAYATLTTVLLAYQGYWLCLLYPVGNMALIVSFDTVDKLFAEERKARQIRAMFSSYVSPKIVEALLADPDKLALGGERRVATILFSDMIGFTSLSEKLPPEDVVAMLNDYYKEMAEIIFRWDGTLDKFVGDEIMAIWNAPVDQPDHAELAVRCALHMSDRLDQLRQLWREQGRAIVDCGIGINTGEVLIGNVGLAGKKMDYTAIGNHVNIAARLEKLTRSYQTRIIISDNTLAGIAGLVESGSVGHVAITSLDSVKVKGKEEAVGIYSVRSLTEEGAAAGKEWGGAGK